MRYHYTKKLLSSVCAVALTVTLSQSMVAEELDTEIPSAGVAVVINNYITNTGSGADIAALLPKEAPAKTVTPVSTGTKKDNKTDSKSTVTNKDKADKYFEDIAIARVYGGEEGYVNVRKKPNVDSKRVGKIYNNCGLKNIRNNI